MKQIKYDKPADELPADSKMILQVYLRPGGLVVAMTEEFRDTLCNEGDPTILVAEIMEAVKDSLSRALRVQ